MGDLKIGNFQPAPGSIYQNAKSKGSTEFTKVIKEAINTVNGAENQADKSIVDLLNGKADVHETMIALQKADISMRLLMTIRNKAIEAYKEIMHMQF